MKLLEEISQIKSKNSKTLIVKSSMDLSRGPRLRSRKIQYEQDDDKIFDDYIEEVQQQSQKETIQKQAIQSSIQGKKSISKEISKEISNTQKNQAYQTPMKMGKLQKNSDQENDEDINAYITPIKRKKREVRPSPYIKVFFCQEFKKIAQVDFEIYFRKLSNIKMLSTLLVNQFGQVIFADRLGSEHFQGSLNNFTRNPIHSMILEAKQEDFFDKISRINTSQSTIVKLLIYSKNSKRRYCKASSEILLTNKDIFNRYLKCVTCEIIPIQITITNLEKFEGYWNKTLIEPGKSLQCYMFKTRLSRKMPKLDGLNFLSDSKIRKFIKYTQRKKLEIKPQDPERKPSGSYLNNSQVRANSLKKFNVSEVLSNRSSDQLIYEMQMNDYAKYSKSVLTRILNSGGGKDQKDKEFHMRLLD